MFHRRRLLAEKREELQGHFDLEVEFGMRQGYSAREAERRARIRLGQLPNGIESSREELGIRWLDGFVSDLQHGFRALTRDRGFGAVAALVLAAGIAVNVLTFSMLEGVVLRPLPYRSPKQLVRLYDSSEGQPKFPMSLGRFLEYREKARSLESIALYTGRDVELTNFLGHSRQLSGVEITSEFFNVLGKSPLMGRAFTDADLHHGVRNVIISYRLWRDHFRSDPAIVGKSVRLDREPWTIIGVSPEGLQHVGGDYRSPQQGDTVDIWLPLDFLDAPEIAIRAFHFCNAIARIRGDFTEKQAQQELTLLAANYSRRVPQFGIWAPRAEPLLTEVTGRSRQVIWLLSAAGMLIMLIACANIAGLCMARTLARRKELSLRSALGASRWRLVRIGLAENVVLSIAGSILGCLIAVAVFPLLHRLLPDDFPRSHEISPTWISAAFGAIVGTATILTAGLLPWGSLGALESQRVTAGRESRRFRTLLVGSEVALAGLLCAGALFLLRSYLEVNARDHGFNPRGALTFQLNVPASDGTKPGSFARTYDAILTKIRAIPGVSDAGASTNLPWSGYDENTGFSIVGQSAANQDAGARYQAATPGYFEATGMRLLEGRLFDPARDGHNQPPALLVNDALANRYFPKGRAVGAELQLDSPARIVGVVAGVQDNPADLDVKPAFWYALEQHESPSVFFVVRSNDVNPLSLVAAVTNAVHAVDPGLALAEVRSLESRSTSALASRRFALCLLQSFAVLGLGLAAAGIYALLAYLVQQRRKELGIRVALGANNWMLWSMILRDGLRIAAGGALVCLTLIPFGGSLLQVFLYNVKAFDPLTVAGVPVLLFGVAVLASLGPAWSAMRSDPAITLRDD